MTDVSSTSCTKKRRRSSVTFSKVEVFYFDRAQGFICVPSQGGSTLGMQAMHWASEEFSVNSHQHFRLLERYLLILKKYRNGKILLGPGQIEYLEKTIRCAPEVLRNRIFRCYSQQWNSLLDVLTPNLSSLADSNLMEQFCSDLNNNADSSAEPHLTVMPVVRQPIVCDDLLPVEEDERLSSVLDCYFLPLLSVKKRRILLRRAGLRVLDPAERMECQAIRLSRDICGCNCTDGICLPNECQCALNGIKCQVDRLSFPCPCTKAVTCQNPEGRVEFNPIRVRTHYLHTRMRLEMESDTSTSSILDGNNDFVISKRPRLKGETSTDVNGLNDIPDEANAPELYSNSEAKIPSKFATQSTSNISLFNTTLNGGCRDCEENHYVHLFMQEFVSQTEESVCNTPDLSDSFPFSNESPELQSIRSHPSGELLPEVFPNCCIDNATEQTLPPVLIASQSCDETLFTNEPTSSSYFKENETLDSLPCANEQLARETEYYADLHTSTSEPCEEKIPSTDSFNAFSHVEAPLSFSTEQEQTMISETPIDAELSPPASISDPNSTVKCTLEPISSLFASCTTVVAGDQTAVDQSKCRSDSDNQTVYCCEDLTSAGSKEEPLVPATSPAQQLEFVTDNTSSSLSNVDSKCTEAVSSSATNTSDTGLRRRKLCSETENVTPPNSPYLESVPA